MKKRLVNGAAILTKKDGDGNLLLIMLGTENYLLTSIRTK
jgi:hypothetical protein